MPPRSAKKAAARTARGAARARISKVEEPAIVDEMEAAIEVEVETEPPMADTEPEVDANRSVSLTKAAKDMHKENEEEYKGECLEVEYNDHGHEPEEDQGLDYDGMDVEDDGGEQDGDEYEVMEGDVEGGEPELIEEIEYDEEDVEGGEGDGNGDEEHEADDDAEEHHEVVHEHRKRKEFEVFVGGLDKDATENDLKEVFSQVGEIVQIRLMMNPQTKKNKGFAFLRFATVEQAQRAVSELKKPVVNGKQCGVSPSQDNDTLFLGNINKSWTKERLKEKLKYYEVDNLQDLTLVEDTKNKGMNRGFAFLEFYSRSEAMDAFKRLKRRGVLFGVDRTAKVAFADTFTEPDDEIMAQVKTVFLDGISSTWDEDHVKKYVKKFGEVEKIELARNMPLAKRKDFGFVTFSTHDAAVACAKGANNAELGEGENKVKVRARLSRPLQRNRGFYNTRGDFRVSKGPQYGGRFARDSRPAPRGFAHHGTRTLGVRGASSGTREFKRVSDLRDRRPAMVASDRVRLLPSERTYLRRPPVSAYLKSSSKRQYSKLEEIPSRNRATSDYGSRIHVERRAIYRDEYVPKEPGYSNAPPRPVSRTVPRRSYVEDAYDQRFERPSSAIYREVRSRDYDYDSSSSSKRVYLAIDDGSPRYADVDIRHSRAHSDYDVSGTSVQYSDVYSERPGRSHLGYGGSRSSLSGQESHGLFSSRHQGAHYSAGSASVSDAGGMYTSSYDRSYVSRGSDVGSSSYSSMYSDRTLSGSGDYLERRGSRAYY